LLPFLLLALVDFGAMMLMKRSNFAQLGLATVLFLFALSLPTTAPAWLFVLSLTLAIGCGLFGACSVCNILDDDKFFLLSPTRLEQLRAMHRRGDG
jgi:hypothetical protein